METAATLVVEVGEMMYTGPIMRTYDSEREYNNDAANMARFGYQVMNVQSDRVTDGCRLTAILIIALLLAVTLIGLLVLLFLPFAFSTRITVHYVYTGVAPAYPQHSLPPQGVPAPVTRQLDPEDDAWPAQTGRTGFISGIVVRLTAYVSRIHAVFTDLSLPRKIMLVMVAALILYVTISAGGFVVHTVFGR